MSFNSVNGIKNSLLDSSVIYKELALLIETSTKPFFDNMC